VLVHAPQTSVVVARAVVEDIATGGGLARITQVMAATQTTIDASHRVMLQSGPALSSGGAARADVGKAEPQRTRVQAQIEVRQELQAQRDLRGAGIAAFMRMR
jgi:predicted PhzF superfamily epimerase YddE/YHI9